ncbi:MAG TPA: hypothetical protein VGZ92_07375 [Bradyrhizobium sp.]|jgi:hypothetical protein|nr:hypothetical protein [Bradyrhizobium sp.]
MKLMTIALASALALSGTAALAQAGHRSAVKAYHRTVGAMPMPRHTIDYGNPNGDPDGPTSLSGTGSSQFGGSVAGATGYN